MEVEMLNREDESFIASRTVITTTTLYKGWYPGKLHDNGDTEKVRGDLALETISAAVDLGFRVVVADRLSPEAFSEKLKSTGALVVPTESTKRSPGRREVFAKASLLPNAEAIVWTEPEKVDIVRSIPKISKPIVMGEADLVIPARNPELFKEFYPSYMYESEIIANRLFNRFLRKHSLLSEGESDLDVFFGARVFGKKAIDLAMKKYAITDENLQKAGEFIDPEEYSDAIYFPVIASLFNNLKVVGVEIPFKYPISQKMNEEAITSGRIEEFKMYREKQRKGILVGAAQFLNYLQNRKSSIQEIT